MNLNQVTVPTSDIKASKIFYQNLGLNLIVDTDHYLRFECPEGDSTFSVHHMESFNNNSGISIYFETENLDKEVERLSQIGFSFEQMPTDQSWLWREARLKDPVGNHVILYFAGSNRKNPPWRIN